MDTLKLKLFFLNIGVYCVLMNKLLDYDEFYLP